MTTANTKINPELKLESVDGLMLGAGGGGSSSSHDNSKLPDDVLMPSSMDDLLAFVGDDGQCLDMDPLGGDLSMGNVVDPSFWSALTSITPTLPSEVATPSSAEQHHSAPATLKSTGEIWLTNQQITPQHQQNAPQHPPHHQSQPPTPTYTPFNASMMHAAAAAAGAVHPLGQTGDALPPPPPHATNTGFPGLLPPTPPIEASYVACQAPMPLPAQANSLANMIMTSPFHPNIKMHAQPRRRSDHGAYPPHPHPHPQQQQQQRRQSSTRRRASSVASVVSLTAHEPVAHFVNGIEHITFLYSHERLVKEYTVRTDINSVNLDDIPMDFRLQNAIYPRANVDKEEYDGNRWNYETSCNELGWKLCWLNRDQLFGKRGLIQRAVDSYRNRHAELRSRRVTRQEKVANGTLRKRRTKKLVGTYY